MSGDALGRYEAAMKDIEENGMPYYDRAGRRIGLFEWAALFEDLEYRFVAKTRVGTCGVSTIWVGHDMSLWPGTPFPLIFETAVAWPGALRIMARYASEVDALAGHQLYTTDLERILAALTGGGDS